MKVVLTNKEFQSNMNRLIAGLVEGDDVTNYSVNDNNSQIQILLGDYCLELNKNGKWNMC
jgi:hypothetical protein